MVNRPTNCINCGAMLPLDSKVCSYCKSPYERRLGNAFAGLSKEQLDKIKATWFSVFGYYPMFES